MSKTVPAKKDTAIGTDAAQRSGGLFSANDWKCAMCGNINWLRRLQCNECKAPKPGSVDETREGRGGGYNERENVEYKDRAESDSEYDEFGRKKKKPKVTEQSKNVSKGEEEDDEEDDGEDDDRWNAWADLVDDDKATAKDDKDKAKDDKTTTSKDPRDKKSADTKGSSSSSSGRPDHSRSRSRSRDRRRHSRSRSRSRGRRRRSRSRSRDRGSRYSDRDRDRNRDDHRDRDRGGRRHSRSRSRSRSRDRYRR